MKFIPVSVKSKVLVPGTVCVLLSATFPAWAALGGDITSIQSDQVHMQGTIRTTAKSSYSVHEIQSSAGTVVREYVASTGNSAGKVFAVAWQSPWPPDMRQLLGSYFEQYLQAAKAQSASRLGRRPVMIDQPGLVVQISGHPRSFTGRAYVPQMLPSDVRAEDIQ
ncbi:MAG: DUF2844 domain-containing protein [Candidatus Sulfotelmatobacter sp.]